MPRFASTYTPLPANQSVTLNLFANNDDYLIGAVFADQAGTLWIEQSLDNGVNWDIQTSYSISANDGKGFSEPILWPNLRVRYVNGGVDQTQFRLGVRFSSVGYRG